MKREKGNKPRLQLQKIVTINEDSLTQEPTCFIFERLKGSLFTSNDFLTTQSPGYFYFFFLTSVFLN